MSVALIATVVQHSENGIILEDDSTDADQLAKDLMDPKLIHEKAVAAISHQVIIRATRHFVYIINPPAMID